MINSSKRSLFSQLVFIILGVVVLSLGVHTIYSYQEAKKRALTDIKQDIKTVTESLQQSLDYFISSYAVNEYERLLISLMQRNHIAAIVVQDYNMQELTQDEFVVGEIRDKKGEIVPYKQAVHGSWLQEYAFSKSAVIENSNGKELGKVSVYASDEELNAYLQSLLIRHIGAALIMTAVMISLLFMLIRAKLIQPLQTLISQIKDTDKNAIPKHVSTFDASKEMRVLSESIQNMVKTIKTSKVQLQKERDRFLLAVEGSNDGLWDWDIANNEVYFAPRWKKMLGYAEDELQNSFQTWESRIHPEDKAAVFEQLNDYLAQKSSEFAPEFRMRHKDGSWVWILARAKARFDKKGRPLRMVGSHTDITIRKNLEFSLQKKVSDQLQELRQKDQLLQQQARMAAMGEMIGAIAHQWRQPLNALSINIQNLDDDYEDGLVNEDFIDRFIEKNTTLINYMSKTIDDFRNFFKTDKSKTLFGVKACIDDVQKLQGAQLKNHNIELIVEGEDFSIKAVQSELEQVVLNLLSNAKDAILEENRDDGVIRIDLDNPCISVSDNGKKIPDEIIDKIYDPYFTTKDQGQGTGIGLYMSKTIVERNMKGTIEAKNLTEGACFRVCLQDAANIASAQEKA
ncbi:MAG: sensor histidine kinase [Campylobacterota bacterium]